MRYEYPRTERDRATLARLHTACDAQFSMGLASWIQFMNAFASAELHEDGDGMPWVEAMRLCSDVVWC